MKHVAVRRSMRSAPAVWRCLRRMGSGVVVVALVALASPGLMGHSALTTATIHGAGSGYCSGVGGSNVGASADNVYACQGYDNDASSFAKLGSATIPGSVTNIGTQAFYDCSRLAPSVVIGDKVTYLGDNAFGSCGSLRRALSLATASPSSGTTSFRYCSGAEPNVTIGTNVTSVGNFAFYGCGSLGGVTLPDSVTNIGGYALYNCSGLTAWRFPAASPPLATARL